MKIKFRESAWKDWECFIENKLPISFGFGDTQIDALKMAVDNFPSGYSSVVERLPSKQNVVGSNPPTRSKGL